MPQSISVSDALAILHTRADLLRRGLGDRQLRDLVIAGRIRRVRRGRYVMAEDWQSLWNEGRHLVEVVAAHLNARGPGLLFCGPSAAVLHGLPLYRTQPRTVHVVTEDERHGRVHAGIRWHHTSVVASDVVEVDGIRCTVIDRTVLDLSRSLSQEAAIAAADAALRADAVDGHVQDEERADVWRRRLIARAAAVHGRGIRRARRVIEFADGRAQLPGESVSRWQLGVLGFRHLDLQVKVVGPSGENYWLDFGFPRSQAFGEFDGQGKYVDQSMRGARSVEQVVLDEKRREDAIRGVTGWRVVRWDSSDVISIERFAARLAAFGIRPPG
jgi:predicted transcriptional regulator of viral defense system